MIDLELLNEKRYLLIEGDCLSVLNELPDESINCVITSPPYWNLRKYDISKENTTFIIGNEEKPEDYVGNLNKVFSLVYKKLKTNGSLWLNLGDKYSKKHLMGMPWRVALKLIENGWILRNDIIWDQMKGTQSAKDRLRDVYEHIFFFVKSEKYYFAHNEIRIKPLRKPKTYKGEIISATGVSGIKYRKQIETSSYLTDDEKRMALNALNEVINEMINNEVVDFRMTIRGQQRAFHSDNNNISGRAKELDEKGYYILKVRANGHLPSDIWRIAPEDEWRTDAHYAVFPEELLENPIRATCPENGVVLDPFVGTGSTIITSLKLGRKSIGIDLSKEYIKVSQKRIDNCPLTLF